MPTKRKKNEFYFSGEAMPENKTITVKAVVSGQMDVQRLAASIAKLPKKKRVPVEAVVSGQMAVQRLSTSVAKLPKKKKVAVETVAAVDSQSMAKAKNSLNQISSGAVQVTKDLGQVSTTAIQTGGALAKIDSAGEFKTVKQGLNNIDAGCSKAAGSAKNLWSSFSSGGSAVSIITQGVQSLIKLTMDFLDYLDKPMKEAAELAGRNAKSVQGVGDANEETRQKTDAYMARLGELANQEKLSNVNKHEARKLIGELQKSYGDLGIKIDEGTGKITGVDEATETKLQKDQDGRIRDSESEIKHLTEERAAQAKIRDHAGMPISLSGDTRLGGGADIEKASAKIEEIDSQIMEARKKLREAKKADPVKEYRERRQAEKMDQEEAAAMEAKQDGSASPEEASAAKLESEAKLQLPAAGSTQQLLAPGTEGGGGSGMEHFGKPGGGLFDQAMRGAAGGLSLEEAMRSAQEKKGSELSGEEAGEVRKLAELSDGDSELRETPSADLSLKTNSLTARGGFASGAKAPDSEKINREIANHGKKQNELLEKVFNILDSMEK